MPYDITKYEPGYGGTIDSSGNVKNIADSIDASGNFKVAGSFSVTPSGTQTINNAVVTATMQNAATATGNGTTLNTTNQAMAVLDVQGTFVGTIIVEATIDGTNYFTIKTTDMSTDSRVASITAPGQFSLRASGYQNVRARISAYTSGSITVYGRAVAGGISHHTAAITNNTYSSIGDTGVAPSSIPANSNYLYNGASWDAWRNNQSVTALALSARTATISTSDITNYNYRGIAVMIYVNSAGTGSLTVTIEGKNPTGGSQYRQLNTTYTALTGTGMSAYLIYPGSSAAANWSKADTQALPKTFRITVTHADSSSWSYSVGYDLIL